MNGLHACKPGNEPQVGQVKNFTIINYPANGTKKAYTKIKSTSPDQGGTPYKITSVKPTGYTDSYGNVSFNLDIEPADGSSATPPQRGASPAPRAASQNGWDDRSSRIERQHSQEMGLRYATLKGLNTITTEELRKLIDWFQKDVSHVPGDDKPATPDVPYQQGNLDDEIPF